VLVRVVASLAVAVTVNEAVGRHLTTARDFGGATATHDTSTGAGSPTSAQQWRQSGRSPFNV
jgi:hypothetical protein